MKIAVIVPIYRHSVLLFDAVTSLWGDHDPDCEVVLVDDGCPEMATMLGGLGLAGLSSHAHYVRSANRGLSGARNRGITFVLDYLDKVEGMLFLDADNMLANWSVRRMEQALAEQPEADWFYPDIRMFGLEWEGDYSGPFHLLGLSLENLCEAGSLVRRRVFEAGIRFSEEMRLGFEDWDFWLSAAEHGFRGAHFPAAGMRYRKRPESMLADSTRDADVIRSQLDKRHPWRGDLRMMLALEHRECPRYAIYLQDLNVVRLTSSAEACTEEMSWLVYQTRFWAAVRAPGSTHAGNLLIVTTGANIRLLQESRLWSWALADLERRLLDSNIATLTVSPPIGDSIVIAESEIGSPPNALCAAISVKLLHEIALDADGEWISSVDSPQPSPRISWRSIALPDWVNVPSRPRNILGTLVGLCRDIGSSEHAASRLLPDPGMAQGAPSRARLSRMLADRFGGLLPPMIRQQLPEVAFVLPLCEFGGVEKVALFVAHALKRRGYGVNLVICKSAVVRLATQVCRTFDRIWFLDNPAFENWSGPSYLGTSLSRWSVGDDHGLELNMLSQFDAVIACHAGDVLGVMGKLRRRGVVTASHVHVFDHTDLERNIGHPMLAVAFEHALDLVIGCSEQICTDMHALGIPASKIVHVPNAPGLEVAPRRAEALQAERRSRRGPELNVLFLGRLDRQKGLDRLARIGAALAADPRVRLRVIGKSVIGLDGETDELRRIVEPPIWATRELVAAYGWADVLILPSLYEGLPLTVMEAMLLGVVPIAAAAGAVREAVEDGVNGFVVTQQDCAEETLERIKQLAADRTMLLRMSEAAVHSMRDCAWDGSVEALDLALQTQFRRKRPKSAATTLLPVSRAGQRRASLVKGQALDC